MCRLVLLAIVALLSVSPVHAQAPSSAERELIKLENDWATAEQKRDSAFFQKFLADEFIETWSDGTLHNKVAAIADVTSAGSVVESVLVSDLKVRVYGDFAVVTGSSTEKSTLNGKDTGGTFRHTDVWVKRDGRWQLVAAHWSRIAKP